MFFSNHVGVVPTVHLVTPDTWLHFPFVSLCSQDAAITENEHGSTEATKSPPRLIEIVLALASCDICVPKASGQVSGLVCLRAASPFWKLPFSWIPHSQDSFLLRRPLSPSLLPLGIGTARGGGPSSALIPASWHCPALRAVPAFICNVIRRHLSVQASQLPASSPAAYAADLLACPSEGRGDSAGPTLLPPVLFPTCVEVPPRAESPCCFLPNRSRKLCASLRQLTPSPLLHGSGHRPAPRQSPPCPCHPLVPSARGSPAAWKPHPMALGQRRALPGSPRGSDESGSSRGSGAHGPCRRGPGRGPGLLVRLPHLPLSPWPGTLQPRPCSWGLRLCRFLPLVVGPRVHCTRPPGPLPAPRPVLGALRS